MNPVLHVISDRQRHALPLPEALTQAALGGADVLQIREKKAPAAEVYALCLEVRERCQAAGVRPQLFVNDRIDVAIALEADGVHLAAKSLPVAVARGLAERSGWKGVIGCSVHSLEEAIAAEASGADYVTFGHVFASESHPGVPPRGLYALRRVVEAVRIPVIAIGGIDPANVAAVLATGCHGVAVIGAVINQP
ncbi:thiamine phosphate synthase, partial [Alicyclobacillus sp.]|uniref:thiamine phosphate synthase n=1 Tax=Alicyclobacillus sp. TaxID=61169 RepID=UPI0025C54D84